MPWLVYALTEVKHLATGLVRCGPCLCPLCTDSCCRPKTSLAWKPGSRVPGTQALLFQQNTALDPEDYNSRISGSQGRGIKAGKIFGISLTIYLYGASLLLISDLRAEGDEWPISSDDLEAQRALRWPSRIHLLQAMSGID